jgi:hypothetical protein
MLLQDEHDTPTFAEQRLAAVRKGVEEMVRRDDIHTGPLDLAIHSDVLNHDLTVVGYAGTALRA